MCVSANLLCRPSALNSIRERERASERGSTADSEESQCVFILAARPRSAHSYIAATTAALTLDSISLQSTLMYFWLQSGRPRKKAHLQR